MSWAARRRFIILLIIGAVIAAFLAVLSITVFYQAPSCSDGVQNQDEVGIDCGGSCSYLCADQTRAPVVRFTKALTNSSGRTDIIASVENKNAGVAAKSIPYTITLYGTGDAVIHTVTGIFDLPPAATVPIFIPGVVSGGQKTVRAFLTIDPSAPQWFTMTNDTRVKPVVSNTILGGTATLPRIDAVLTNAGAIDLKDIPVIVLVRDTGGEIIAASKTVMPSIPAQGKAMATFTWNEPFSSVPAAIEVVPTVPLP